MKKKLLQLIDIGLLERIAKSATRDAAIRTRENGRTAWGAQDGWLVKTFGTPDDPTVQRVRQLSAKSPLKNKTQ